MACTAVVKRKKGRVGGKQSWRSGADRVAKSSLERCRRGHKNVSCKLETAPIIIEPYLLAVARNKRKTPFCSKVHFAPSSAAVYNVRPRCADSPTRKSWFISSKTAWGPRFHQQQKKKKKKEKRKKKFFSSRRLLARSQITRNAQETHGTFSEHLV